LIGSDNTPVKLKKNEACSDCYNAAEKLIYEYMYSHPSTSKLRAFIIYTDNSVEEEFSHQ